LGGVAAAWSLARADRPVVVIEQTGVLGREITRSRLTEWNPADITTDFGCELIDRLKRFEGIVGGGIDALACAHVLDTMLADVGVDVLFHVWPVGLDPSDPQRPRVHVASRQGRDVLEAGSVIDISPGGRIAREAGLPSPRRTGRSRLDMVWHVDPDQWRTTPSGRSAIDDGQGLYVDWRPAPPPGEVIVRIFARRPPLDSWGHLVGTICGWIATSSVLNRGSLALVADEPFTAFDVVDALAATDVTDSVHGGWDRVARADIDDDSSILSAVVQDGIDAANQVSDPPSRTHHF
jgi:hypothetical protein